MFSNFGCIKSHFYLLFFEIENSILVLWMVTDCNSKALFWNVSSFICERVLKSVLLYKNDYPKTMYVNVAYWPKKWYVYTIQSAQCPT